jgi:hypothetical protein
MMPSFLPTITTCFRRPIDLRIIIIITYPLSVSMHETTREQVPLQFA